MMTHKFFAHFITKMPQLKLKLGVKVTNYTTPTFTQTYTKIVLIKYLITIITLSHL